ncbi:MAG: outer membrane beta-barrel protein [Bacteroidia bacterium]|nr:outer membrane beta-barrel protein [Bacteroidia bacterium]MDW8088562.1 outer membrane beta-barrel protein [Bacteroidia bacterium]
MRWVFWLTLLAWAFGQEERLTSPKAPGLPRAQVVGRVIDGRTGEPLMGVQVRLGSLGTYTDEKGGFTLTFTQADTLQVFLLGYHILRVPLHQPTDNLILRLSPIEAELAEVSIVEEADRATEGGLLLERLRALEIAELYAQELIMKRSTDFYVPNVLRRLPGVSLLSGRYISIRGMGERYNAFAFWAAYPAWLSYDASFGELEHLITTLLGRVEVRKFWTPELLGHFGGGMVDFQLPRTSSTGWQIAYTAEIDAQATGQPFYAFRLPLRDPIPPDFPDPATIQASENNGRPLPENFAYGQRFRRYTIPNRQSWAPPGSLLTLSYDKSGSRWRFSLRSALSQRYLRSSIKFADGTFEEVDGSWQFMPTVRSLTTHPLYYYSLGGGLSGTLSLQLSSAHSLLLEGFYLQNTYQRFSTEEAEYINPAIDSFIPVWSVYSSFLTQRSYLGILRLAWIFTARNSWQGRLQLGGLLQGQAIPQTGAMNYIRYPNTEELTYEHEMYDEGEIYAQVFTTKSHALQGYVHPYIEKRWDVGQSWLQLRLGGWYSRESQRFRARQLGFLTDTAGGGPNVLPSEVYAWDNIREVYNPAYIREGGFYLIDRTGDYHRHRGETEILAGYGWFRTAFGKRWEMLVGARYETWARTLYHIPILTPRETTFARYREGHLLPAFLAKYALTERHILRLGANLTLIRPSLPTQVPFKYFDYLWAFYWVGDPSVTSGRIYNVELRYEWLRDKDNLLAIGLFYKHLRNLPEIYLIPASYNLVFTYSTRQRRWGEIMGIEIEARRTWWENPKGRLWGYATLTLSESALERPLGGKLGRLEGRIQGHAPLVGNLGLLYSSFRWEAALFFNYTSAQIWAIGFDPYIYPHLVEERRLTGEAQFSYHLSSRWEFRIAIWDFINPPYRRTQRVGNADTFQNERDAMAIWERWAYRGYVTIRYKF